VQKGELSRSAAEGCTLDREQPGLGGASTGSRKPTGLTASGQNSMARDNDWDGISSQGLAHGSGCGGEAESFGKLAVGPGLARRDFSSGFVYPSRKQTLSLQVYNDVAKILKFALEMLAHSRDDLGNLGRRGARLPRTAALRNSRFRHRRRGFRKLKARHGSLRAASLGLGPGNPTPAERRLEQAISSLLHWAARLIGPWLIYRLYFEQWVEHLAGGLGPKNRQRRVRQKPNLLEHGTLVPVDVFVRKLAFPELDNRN